MTTTPTTPSQTEQRLTFRLLSYWNRIRGERPLPCLSDVNIEEIKELWYFSFTIDLREPVHRFHYFGSSLSDIFQEDYTGRSVQELVDEDVVVNNTIGFYERAVVSREPVMEAASFVLDAGEVRYRSIIVPLSSDGQIIDFLMGTTNYKIFPVS
jgi:hypothetical protein